MNYYNEIKNELINNEITKKVKDYSKNRSDLTTYYNVGKLSPHEQVCVYGGIIFLSKKDKDKFITQYRSIIKEYSIKLTNELGKGYTITRLKYMRRYYEVLTKGPTLSDLLSYSHYCELIWFEDFNKIEYYIKITIEQNLSVRQLRERIKNKEYERLDETAREKLITKEETSLVDFIKNPIVIKNSINKEIISEKALQRIIMEDLPFF